MEYKFNGDDYKPNRDYNRLSTQLEVIKNLMSDGNWRTLDAIHLATGEPVASISAQLRNLRKPKNGGYKVDRRYVANGLYEYRLDIQLAS